MKFGVSEEEADALRLRTRSVLRPFSSMLVHTELLRAVQGAGTAAVSPRGLVLSGLVLVAVTREILEAARSIRTEARLPMLDAVHLATALAADERRVEMIVCDDRLRSEAVELGLPTAAPT